MTDMMLVMKKLFQLIRLSAGLRQSFQLIGGSLFAGVFSAIAFIMISRHLGPTLFAEFTVGYSLMMIISKIQGLGLNVALQKIAGPYFQYPDVNQRLSKLFRVANRINGLIVIGSTILGAILAWPISNLLHFPHPEILFGSFVFASVTMLFDYSTAILQIMHRFSGSVVMLVLQALAKLTVALVIKFLGAESVPLLFSLFYGVPILSVGLLPKFMSKEIHLWPMARDRELEAKLWRIMRHSVILVATIGVIDYLDVLFVQKFTTPFQTGIYGGIVELNTVITTIAYALAAVLNARVARYHHVSHLQSFMKKSMAIWLVVIGGFILYLPFSQLMIELTIGHQYLSGASYLPWMILSGCLLTLSVPFAALFYSFDHPRYFSLSGLGQMLITIIGGLVFIPRFGLAGAVGVKVMTRLFLLLFTLGFALIAYQQKKSRELTSASSTQMSASNQF